MKFILVGLLALSSVSIFATEILDVYTTKIPTASRFSPYLDVYNQYEMETNAGQKIILYCLRSAGVELEGKSEIIIVEHKICDEFSVRNAGTQVEWTFAANTLISVRFINL